MMFAGFLVAETCKALRSVVGGGSFFDGWSSPSPDVDSPRWRHVKGRKGVAKARAEMSVWRSNLGSREAGESRQGVWVEGACSSEVGVLSRVHWWKRGLVRLSLYGVSQLRTHSRVTKGVRGSDKEAMPLHGYPLKRGHGW
jgi:hypothetical protein